MDVSPWIMLIAICCLWPSLLFGLGLLIGRRGLPIHIERRWGRDHTQEQD